MPVFVRHYVVITLCLAASIWLGPSPVSAQGLDIAEGREHFEELRIEEALKIIEPLADRGDAEAQYLLGIAYEIGHSPKQHHAARALHWYLKSAKSGNACARRRIIESMFFGSKRYYQKPDEFWFRYQKLNDGPTRETYVWLLEEELYRIASPEKYDKLMLLVRRTYIAVLAWGKAATDNGIPHAGYIFFRLVRSFKHNEELIAELLSETAVSGELWRWLAEVRADWPTDCDR